MPLYIRVACHFCYGLLRLTGADRPARFSTSHLTEQRLGDTRSPSRMLSPSMADSLSASNGMRFIHPHAPMTRKVTRTQKTRGKQATVNGHSLVIVAPRGQASVPVVEANLRRLVAGRRSNTVWDFTKFPRYVQVIAQCMGIRQERFPCCYGPQMPQSSFRSVRAT